MSIKIMELVWEIEDLTPSETLLLISLADQANHAGVCWPGQGTMRRRTKLSERTIQALLRSLRLKGYITWKVRPGHSNVYQLPIPVIHTPAVIAPRNLDTPDTIAPHPRSDCPPPPQPLPPESKRTVIESKTRAREKIFEPPNQSTREALFKAINKIPPPTSTAKGKKR